MKTGDKIAVRCKYYSSVWYEVSNVSKVTPKGQVVLANGTRFKQDERFGYREIGGSNIARWIVEWNPDIQLKADAHAARKRIERCKWDTLSDEKVIAIAQILDGTLPAYEPIQTDELMYS